MKRHVQNLYERDNCHPLKQFILPWIQVPLWISMSLALRNMTGSVYVSGMRRYFTDTVVMQRECNKQLNAFSYSLMENNKIKTVHHAVRPFTYTSRCTKLTELQQLIKFQ